MSAAVDICSSDASPHFQPFTKRESGHREAMPPVRRSFLAIVGGRRHYAAAELLQQVIYLTEWRDKRSLSVRYLADNLDCNIDVVHTAKSRLLELGFVQLSKGSGVRGADRWYLRVEAILEALDEAGYEATRGQLLGRPDPPDNPPDQSDSPDRSGGPNDPPFGRAERSDSPDRSGGPNKEYIKENKKDSDSLAADGRGREREGKTDSKPTETTPAPPIKHLDEYIREAFERFSISVEQAKTIRETLTETFGLPEQTIRAYVAERAADFAGRSRQLSRSEVVRYTTSRQDLVDRGYTQPIRTVETETPTPDPTRSETNETHKKPDPEPGSKQHFYSRMHEVLEELGGFEHFDEAEATVEAEWRKQGWTVPQN